jgi:CBS domain-containing protein
MNAGDIMSDEVFTCRATDVLDTPARLMWEHDCGSVPVVDDEQRVVGVITDRDICMAAYTQGRRLSEMSVSSAMSRQVHACSAGDGLAAVERIMREERVRRVPVVDAGRLVGIVSLGDLALAALDGLGIPNAPVSAERVVLTLGTVCQPRSVTSTAPAEVARDGASSDGGRSLPDERPQGDRSQGASVKSARTSEEQGSQAVNSSSSQGRTGSERAASGRPAKGLL